MIRLLRLFTGRCARGAVWNVTTTYDLGDQVAFADGFISRLIGLLGHDRLDPGEGLLIAPSRGVHMMGMRFPIDVALLDSDRRVVGTFPNLTPGRNTAVHRKARFALELPPGTLDSTGTRVGHHIDWRA